MNDFNEIYNESKVDDSTASSMEHKNNVKKILFSFISNLISRSFHHDDSKLVEPEKSLFDEYTPKLKDCKYGSDKYKELLKGLSVALNHHYAVNSHHPEHYENGINGMDLLDLMEMMADWKASTLRNKDGDISKSLEINKKRFGISDQLFDILNNTINRYLK